MTTPNHNVNLPADKMKEFTEAFQAMDKSGLIGPFELGILMRSLNQNPTDDDLNVIIDEYSVYEKGGVNLKEFLLIMSKREAESVLKEKLTIAFGTLSRDDNGYVPITELKDNMMTVGENPYSEKEFEEFISEFQLDADGQLDISAFVDLMCKNKAGPAP